MQSDDRGGLDPHVVFEPKNNAEASYLSACIARGQRAGNVKPVALDPRDGWTAKFQGRFIETRAAAGSGS
jgi:hypothetical protein